MKTFRKMNHYGGYWARFRRIERKQKRFHNHYYPIREIACARAAWVMDREKILSRRYPIRNFYGEKNKP